MKNVDLNKVKANRNNYYNKLIQLKCVCVFVLKILFLNLMTSCFNYNLTRHNLISYYLHNF